MGENFNSENFAENIAENLPLLDNASEISGRFLNHCYDKKSEMEGLEDFLEDCAEDSPESEINELKFGEEDEVLPKISK